MKGITTYFVSRLLEWSTIRGLLIFFGSALGLEVTEQDWDVLRQAFDIVSGAVGDLGDPDSRGHIALGVLMHFTGAAGLAGMLVPDNLISDSWRALLDRFKTPKP